jgi:hypothetical protein
MDPAKTPRRWHRVITGIVLIVAIGVALTVVGDVEFGPGSVVPHVGFLLILLGATFGTNALLWCLMRRRIKALDDVFNEGAHIGYTRGYRDGRREGRPVVVPARCPHCGQALSRTG